MEPENEHIQKQMSLLYSAQISTIDSFARKIVSDNFENPAIDIDPNFRNMDEAEENMLFESFVLFLASITSCCLGVQFIIIHPLPKFGIFHPLVRLF